ncbi:MAG: hypothetical protein ACOCXT_03545 [Candidatus Dojkabacteria bacterium]
MLPLATQLNFGILPDDQVPRALLLDQLHAHRSVVDYSIIMQPDVLTPYERAMMQITPDLLAMDQNPQDRNRLPGEVEVLWPPDGKTMILQASIQRVITYPGGNHGYFVTEEFSTREPTPVGDILEALTHVPLFAAGANDIRLLVANNARNGNYDEKLIVHPATVSQFHMVNSGTGAVTTEPLVVTYSRLPAIERP